MLRLWPDEIRIGLFADHCWLRRNENVARDYPLPMQEFPSGAHRDESPVLLQALGMMLDDPENGVRPGARVVLTVSDTLAAIMALPWQDALKGADELNRYAQLLFEREGREIGSDWVMRAEFRAYASMGLAYAIPENLLADVERIVQARGLQLRRVLPVSAAAFYWSWPGKRAGRRLLLLQAPGRVTALVFSGGRFDGIDVEPTNAGSSDGMRRLLRRIGATHGSVARTAHWSTSPVGHAEINTLLAAEMPDLKPVVVARGALR